MHEDSRIAEAEYFLRRLAAVEGDPTATRYEASAFLSAARSVLQYAREEARGKQDGQAWYGSAVARDPVVKFLKQRRNTDIHERPFPMRTNTNVEFGSAVLTMSSTVVTVLTNADPAAMSPLTAIVRPEAGTAASAAAGSDPGAISRVTHTYEFKGWTGPEDVLALCTRYLAEIKRIVADGRSRGVLTA